MNKARTLISFDWAMKNILRDKANYDVLEDFLSTLLESESNQEDEQVQPGGGRGRRYLRH